MVHSLFNKLCYSSMQQLHVGMKVHTIVIVCVRKNV